MTRLFLVEFYNLQADTSRGESSEANPWTTMESPKETSAGKSELRFGNVPRAPSSLASTTAELPAVVCLYPPLTSLLDLNRRAPLYGAMTRFLAHDYCPCPVCASVGHKSFIR